MSVLHEQIELPDRARRTEAADRIKARALQLGFHKVGIARADALSPEHARLKEWLARGYQGEMGWMARDPEQRADPRKIFPDARSVVVVASNYYTPHAHSDHPDTGKVSRYAWGDDYHEVVGEKLRALLKWIKSQWREAEGKVCVDIQPIMDKAWAQRAGLGWIGKHTNLITEECGSWVFIGELLLSLDLEYEHDQVVDQCGSCTLCIDACPTGAIVEPYVLDSTLCISHATIESRAPEMREDVAAHLEDWLYGCDICQDVCPWNQMTPTTTEPRFEPREGNINADLSELLQLIPDTYAARFRQSAMKRAKLSGLQRNARALQDRQR
ncbi:MAG TPA: tRNA epoxyqueuosine(34) reductase QueG [Pyrinomonadaceae bacterium]|nr:tRNA epoxyqueuosine(34) reductase QueG [Pyrinomonadaceae bacterium]